MAPLYNGNIAQTLWRTSNGDKDIRGYGYSYDRLNRITGADSYRGTKLGTMSGTFEHDVQGIGYDLSGNIKTLSRWGADEGAIPSFGQWVALSYSYNGNQLMKVEDNSESSSHKNFGFKDGMNTGDDYLYDDNGNMIQDLNKGIYSILYNHLNLPTKIHFDSTGLNYIEYVYDATGNKLSKAVQEQINDVLKLQKTFYAGNYIYARGMSGETKLEFFSHAEGYVEPVSGEQKVKGFDTGIGVPGTTYSNYKYVFQYKDHLGNIRLSYSDADLNGAIDPSEIIEESNYYPFGLKQKGYNMDISPDGNALAQQWKFGGKEYNEELGLDWYDVSARNYDPALGRWMNIDPLAEKTMQPYSYANNNPIRFADPTGMIGEDFVLGKSGNIYWDDNANNQATTQAGDTYLGKELSFTFNSNIDGKLWDGPGGNKPVGDKLTSTINLSASENSDGQLTGISATSEVEIGSTPYGTARDYFSGLGDGQNKFGTSQSSNADGTLSNFSLNFEQHASVSPIEALGLDIMGYDVVNVAQQLNISTSGSSLSVSASTDVFPSASLSVNGNQLFRYNQPSFKATHGRDTRTIMGDNGMGGSTVRETTSRRPVPSFHLRYQN